MASSVNGPHTTRYEWRDGLNGATTREGVLRITKVQRLPIRFNSGPTPRHAVLDFARLLEAHPEVWDQLG
jgi:hypothetical protein